MKIGFGSYRIHERSEIHRAALELALAKGCALVDTSANYTDGSSERLIGQVIKDRAAPPTIITKAGYLQGQNLEIAQAREAQGRPFADMVKIGPDLWHCLHPEFLRDQITRSCERLGVTKLDALLLHNPEYYLRTTGATRPEYERRLRQALAFLETERADGRLTSYGVSSNTLGVPAASDEWTSLEFLLRDPLPGLRWIQCPLNLVESGPALEKNCGDHTALELAAERGVNVLLNRPLNAFAGNHLIRLADVPGASKTQNEDDVLSALQTAFEDTLALEESTLDLNAPIPPERLGWGGFLQDSLARIQDLDTWSRVLSYRILPTLEPLLAELEDRGGSAFEWAQAYRAASSALFSAVTEWLRFKSQAQAHAISKQLVKLCPALSEAKTLSRQALAVYQALPAVHSVLLGMRRPAYVEDALDAPLPSISASDALDVLRRFELVYPA